MFLISPIMINIAMNTLIDKSLSTAELNLAFDNILPNDLLESVLPKDILILVPKNASLLHSFFKKRTI